MSKGTLRKQILAAVGAVSLGATAMLGGAASAFGDTTGPGPDQPGAPQSGSLTIHKRIGAEGTQGDGTSLDPAPGTALPGAEFTVWQLGTDVGGTCTAIDLTDPEAWGYLEGISESGVKAPAEIEDVVDDDFCVLPGSAEILVTDANGEASFSALPLSLYYVQETKAPDNIVSAAAPFYVSIPLPKADGTWIYNVHAYPKNQELDKPTKEITEDQGDQLVVGDKVKYTIKQTVPALNAGESYTSASVWDVLPSSLAYVDDSAVITLTEGGSVTILEKGVDYTVGNPSVTWTLTDTGLGKLKAGQELKVVFSATVLEVTANGETANPGSEGETPGYGSEFNKKTIPGEPTPYTYWGQLKVTKHDNHQKALKGAEFEIFPKTGDTCPTDKPAGNAVSTGTSDADGIVKWSPNTPDNSSPLGLFVANSNNGPLNNPTKDYCLYETKAPAGYTGAPVQTVTVKPGTTNISEVTITNVPKEGPNLPLTGGEGTLAMSMGGIALLLAAVGIYTVSRRRQAAQA